MKTLARDKDLETKLFCHFVSDEEIFYNIDYVLAISFLLQNKLECLSHFS
jgi:hypothetical protein